MKLLAGLVMFVMMPGMGWGQSKAEPYTSPGHIPCKAAPTEYIAVCFAEMIEAFKAQTQVIEKAITALEKITLVLEKKNAPTPWAITTPSYQFDPGGTVTLPQPDGNTVVSGDISSDPMRVTIPPKKCWIASLNEVSHCKEAEVIVITPDLHMNPNGVSDGR